jgi:lipopolysaccharide biosynthesis regulator YciM
MKTKNLYSIMSIAAILALSFALTACGGKKEENKADKKLGKLEVEIPAELKDNPEAVEYINGMVEVADEYAILVDELYEEVGEYAGMEEEDLSIKDKLKLTAASANYTISVGEIMLKWGEYESKRVDMYENLAEEDVEAMKVVWEHLEKRFEQIEEKYQEFE